MILWNLFAQPLLDSFAEFPVLLFELDEDGRLAVWRYIEGRYRAAEAASKITNLDTSDIIELLDELTGYCHTPCYSCNNIFDEDNLYTAEDEQHCRSCLEDSFTYCESCNEWVSDATWVNDYAYCNACLDEYCVWCEECETYRHHDDSRCDCGADDCECVAPLLHFKFPANGDGFVAEDERFKVTLAAGVISQEGIRQIALTTARELAVRELIPDRCDMEWRLFNLDPEWQTKQGTFTRRVSKLVYETTKAKVPADLLSEIGNIARQHTIKHAELYVEFTRNLNLPREEFYNDGSCWWTDYAVSRCALKSWGGLAMRSYCCADHDSRDPDGRAWVQPLSANLQPTHRTSAPAYVVYNGYGNLDSYTPARILSHLTGLTYKKIRLVMTPQYINNDMGYLIASEEVCRNTVEVAMSHHYHWLADSESVQAGATEIKVPTLAPTPAEVTV